MADAPHAEWAIRACERLDRATARLERLRVEIRRRVAAGADNSTRWARARLLISSWRAS